MSSLGLSVHEGAEVSTLGPHSLNMDDVLRILHERVQGITSDRGGKLELWHPKVGKLQGVFFGDRHVCSCDRGWSPQWPIFSTKDAMCEVPLGYALDHDDFPVLDILPGQTPEDNMEMLADTSAAAMVLRPQLDDIDYVGWAEVFWKLLRAGVPDIDTYWLSTTFHVPMDWYATSNKSPVFQGFERAKVHCGG